MTHIRLAGVLAVVLVIGQGCGTATPYVGKGPHPQITRGAWIPPVDFIGNVLSLPFKLLLWNWQFNSHSISPNTEARLVQYLEARRLPAFEETTYRLNQYSPIEDLRALIRNRHVAWPYRVFPGLLVTLLYDVVLPGRLLPWGDYFNPYTNSAHLYSDDVTILLHEAGHAYDFADVPLKGTYALVRMVPFFDLSQEWEATENAIDYLQEIGDRQTEYHAYRALWPAYGTYVGNYLIPFGFIPGAIVGHIGGRLKAREQRKYYERMDAALAAPDRALQNLNPVTSRQD